ncbi:MAG TPA: acyloxyacyl hydrolase [Pyrinomonadaceae bacterium]|nr:acyloxyacyl hydrolase [Pyrinomonadaceae bacterium]
MDTYRRIFAATILVILNIAFTVCAQQPRPQLDEATTPSVSDTGVEGTTEALPQTKGDEPYTLRKGHNEFGFWAGGAFQATTIFGGLHDDEARDRGLFMAAFRYGRTLAANDSMALQYTLDAIPIELAIGNITSVTTVGPVTTFTRETTYGGGLTPLGLQLDFMNGSRVHPFVHVNGGGLIFSKSVPLPDAGRFAFVGEAGSGVRIFTSETRAITLGVRFHHISNGDRSGSNRGLNQFVVYGGFSIFK